MARKLGETLIEEGLLTSRQLQEALRSQRIFGGSLGTNLLQLGFIDETGLARALGQMFGVAPATRAELSTASPEVVALLPPEFSRRHRALPFRVDGEDLHLALQNPVDTLAINEASFLTGFRVIPHVTPEAVLRDSLSYHHSFDPGPAQRPGSAEQAPAAAERNADRGLIEDPIRTGPMARSGDTAQGSEPVLARITRPQSRTSEDAAIEQGLATGPVGPPPDAKGRDDQLAGLGAALAAATNRDGILRVLLEELEGHAPRVLLFLVRGETAVLWRSRGFGLHEGRRVEVPLDQPSVLDPVREGSPFRYGPVAITPATQDLYTLLSSRLPRVALIVPVYVKRRPVAILYGDDPRGDARPPDFRRIRKVAGLASLAFEALVLRTKILRESGASDEGS